MRPSISRIHGLEVLDSRGFPTVRACVTLSDGTTAWASVPAAGESGGPKEALQHRDHDDSRYCGHGVRAAALSIGEVIEPRLRGLDPARQDEVDGVLLDLTATTEQPLGANATLGVSMAVARAAATADSLPLYRYLGGAAARRLPLPMMNLLNGGTHADNNIDLEEFMVVPVGASSFGEAIRWGTETFHALRSVLTKRGLATVVGDEGGFAPVLGDDPNRQACELIVEAIEKAGYRPGYDIAIAIDAAAGQFFDGQQYQLRWSGQKPKSAEDMLGLYGSLIWNFPVVALEDGLAAHDWRGSRAQTSLFGWKIQTIGDDLYATNTDHIAEGVRHNATNAVVIRLSQVATVTQGLNAIRACREAGWAPIIAASPADTDDTFTADFTVATGCGQIKAGSACRGERVSKYNRLLVIEQELMGAASFVSPLSWLPWREAAQSPYRRH